MLHGLSGAGAVDQRHDLPHDLRQWEARQAGTRTSVSMGLPFVHAVALALGGDFTAKSDQATGLTTFTFTLPALTTSDKNG